MTAYPTPPPIPPREVLVAAVVSFLLLVAFFCLLHLVERATPPPPPDDDTFITEFLVEDEPAEPSPPTEQTAADAPQPDVVAPPVDTPPLAQQNEQTPPEDVPPPPPEPEQPAAEDPPMEVVVLPPDEARRQSVDQPTTNNEVPEDAEYFLAEVDNATDHQTIAENTTTDYQDDAPVDRSQQDSDVTTPPDVPSPTRDALAEAAAPSATDTPADKDVPDPGEPAQGSPEARARELRALEARRSQERNQQAQTQGDEVRPNDTTPFEQSRDGQVAVAPDSVSSADFGRASGLGAQMQAASERLRQSGAGAASVTREGAVSADARFDELFGERTARAAESSRERSRRESLLGDHAGDWARTREAMENYDVEVSTGTETMLNTRRDDHARFINAFHAKIHDPWWKVLEIMDRRYGPRDSMSNRELTVRLEIRVLGDGKVDRVRIISTSGNTFFDAEAIRVNYDVGVTAQPRADILCEDGSVYLHWTFSRAPGRCGTHGASVHCPRR